MWEGEFPAAKGRVLGYQKRVGQYGYARIVLNLALPSYLDRKNVYSMQR